MNRTNTKKIKVGNITIGGSNNLIIQSMTTTKTSDITNTIKQILELEKYGVEIIRVSILDEDDANSITKIKQSIHIPLIADIHFNSSLAIKAIESGADKIRINPGNFPINDLIDVINKAKEYNIPIRIGVNSGSIDPKYAKLDSVIAMVNSIDEYIKIFENNNFYNLVLSIKSTNINDLLNANRIISNRYSYPIHIGLTEAGDTISSIISSTYSLSQLINEGIGDTIRISINGDKIDEVIACKELLKLTGIRNNIPTLIACPNCGRCMHKTNKIDYNIKYEKAGCIDNFDMHCRCRDSYSRHRLYKEI